MDIFKKEDLRKLFKPNDNSSGEENGQITIIGGSSLFHGAPILSLKVASRIVDMVFFSSPEISVGRVSEQIKSKLMSFIWVPWDEIDAYIEKSDAVLIGPGMMRFARESRIKNQEPKGKKLDGEGSKTREITQRLLKKFPNKKWVIDAGSLQVMEAGWIPENAVITPNSKEFEILFKVKWQDSKTVKEMAEKYNCVIVAKGPETVVADATRSVIIKGGNPGLTKGGSGDVLAGLTAALLAKNDPFLAAASASYVAKASADDLYSKVGTNYNMDDLADLLPIILHNLTK